MESWQAPLPVRLPGEGRPLALYDTARQAVHPAMPESNTATMYVCGITPYDAAHLGHAATMIFFDLINRVWRDNGVDVNYVQNVTDVDDPLFERAARDGEDWVVLGERETALFRRDMAALSILPPSSYVGAVESMPRIVALIERLAERGALYTLDDGSGDVYFPIAAAEGFGTESRYDRETMLALSAERGGDPDRTGKRDPLDPLLWRTHRPGEPSWPSPWGEGRPGWHIECAAIALEYLGERVDVQGGGNDLIFPHHEMSAAHAEVATKVVPFARHYVHAGMVGLDGEKMSKSLGNLVFVSRLREQDVDPAAIRLSLLDARYRDDRQWTDDVLETGLARLRTWRLATALAVGPDARPLLERVRAALSADLDTPAALRAVDEWAADALAGKGSSVTAPELTADLVRSLLGVDV